MLEHLKNTCAHSVTFTQRSVEQHTVFAASRRGGSRLHVPRTERSSGGLFNFLVGAAFHSRARFRPSLSFFFFFLQRSAVIVVLHEDPSDEADLSRSVRN